MFSASGLPEGDYLFRVESDGFLPALGLCHLQGDEPHRVNVVMLKTVPSDIGTAGAGTALRDAVRPPRSVPTPPKVRPAQVRKQVVPVYREAERKAGIEGPVRLSMIIMPDGTVDDLVVLTAPNSNFAMAALLAVRRWQYSPTYLDDQPVEANLTVDVAFQKR